MKRLHARLILGTLVASLFPLLPARADEARWTVETIAGNGQAGDITSGGGAALQQPIDQPFGVELGPDGGLYICSIGQHRVLRLDPKTGMLISVAGNGKIGYAGDGGPADQAQLNEPYEVRFDGQGNMFFVEMKNHLIRRVDARTRAISTVAGSPQSGYAGDDGPAAMARFKQPHSIVVDADGSIYIADIGNHRIRSIDGRTGKITSIAGNGKLELPPDGGQARGAPILGPRALSLVGRTLWIALREGNSVWRLDLDSGIIRHVAGTGKAGYSGDSGPPKDAMFNGPKGIAATAEGVVFLVDSENQAIRRIDTKTNRVDTIAGGGPQARGFAVDKGSALEAKFDRPHGIGLGKASELFIGDTNNHRVRRLNP